MKPFDPSALLDLNNLWILTEIVARTAVVYLVVVLGLRAFGKRELGQMTPFDLVLILTLSNSVQNAMTGPDTSLAGGIVSAFTLLMMNWLLNRLRVDIPWFNKWFIGDPILLVHDGEILQARLRHSGYDEDDLMQAAREHGIDNLKEIRAAVLEVDGTISIVPTSAPEPLKSHHKRRKRVMR